MALRIASATSKSLVRSATVRSVAMARHSSSANVSSKSHSTLSKIGLPVVRTLSYVVRIGLILNVMTMSFDYGEWHNFGSMLLYD